MASTTSGGKDQKHGNENFGHEGKGNTGGGSHGGTSHGTTGTTGVAGAASATLEKAKDMGGQFVDKAKEVGGQFVDKASGAVQGGRKMAENLGERAEDALHAVGSGMKSGGEFLRENMPREGMLGTASSRVADTLDTAGKYFEQHNLGNIGEDLTNLIRRNPLPALLCAAAIGFLFARAANSRS